MTLIEKTFYCIALVMGIANMGCTNEAPTSQPVQSTQPVETDPRLHSSGNGWDLNKATITDKKLPRVLLIGDSILVGYRKFVVEGVKGKAYVDDWVQPYNQGQIKGEDSSLEVAVKGVLANGPYDLIFFNMGLHGWEKGRIPEGEFIPLTHKLVQSIKKGAPKAKLFWLSTTPITEQDTRPQTERFKEKTHALNAELNPTIIEHNRMAAEVMKKEKIPVIDFYNLLVSRRNLAAGDMFHWSEPASKMMGNEIVKTIVSHLPKKPAIKTE